GQRPELTEQSRLVAPALLEVVVEQPAGVDPLPSDARHAPPRSSLADILRRMSDARQSSVVIEGGGLEVLDLPGAAPALVLLHEGLGSVRLWRDFPAALAHATAARVAPFSRFGHGDSDLPPRPRTPRFMHEEALEVLPAVLR